MSTKQTEALKLALEALEAEHSAVYGTSQTARAITAIREALAEQPAQDDPCPGCRKGVVCKTPKCGRLKLPVDHPFRVEQPAPPPECKTDAEKTAFAFGWWKALEENRKQPAQDREPCGWRMKHNGEWAYSFTEDAWDFIRRIPKAQQQEPVAGWDSIEAMAAERYKVVPSHDSMFYRHAVVAGNGNQQLYLGRELDCENMARKFAGAFLDGAFVMQSRTSPPASKPWVGLTDEDILRTKSQFKGTLDVQFDKFAYAIEAKLREKNA